VSTQKTTPFAPVNELSYAEQLYRALRELPTGRIIAHDDQGLPFRLSERPNAVQSACRRMEREQQRTLASIRGVGYKIVAGAEHVEIASRHLRSSQKRARRAQKCATAIDRREMDAVEQMRADDIVFRAAAMARAANATSQRLSPEEILST
jgi:hypothetical protein